jgi:phosphopantetheinyl transferase
VPLIVAQDGAVDVDGFDLHLSISHTDEGAIAVVSPRPVGVDLEPIDRQIADLHSYILTDEEYTRLPDGPIGDLPVLQSWVAKESVLKGMRTGLRTSPKELVLTFDGFGGRAFHRDGAVWRFVLVESGGFVASVAYQE